MTALARQPIPARSTDTHWVPLPMQRKALACGAFELFLGGSAGPGKGLAVDTEIPTPSGWSTMGDLRAGDEVFAGDGSVCRVVAVSAVHQRPCFRLTFDDGATIIADDVHRWLTMTNDERSSVLKRSPEWKAKRRASRASRATGVRPWQAGHNSARAAARRASNLPASVAQVRDTAELARTVLTDRGRANHTIPVVPALVLPEADLPIDPYVLGAWLGDGTTRGGSITSADIEIIDRVTQHYRRGFVSPSGSRASAYGFCGLQADLRAAGVLGAKHIPPRYFRASIAQRLELLRGIVDTDGHVDRDGRVEVCGVKKRLAEDVLALALSLGLKARMAEGRATLNGVDMGPKYLVTWCSTLATAWLPRKAAKLPTKVRPWITSHRYLVSVEPVPSVPTRCITVDSADHTFVAGRSLVVTHNSEYLVVAPLRWVHEPTFRAVLFRNSFPELQRTLIEKSRKFYPSTGATYNETGHLWKFPSGASVEFAYLERDADVHRYQGAEFQFVGFDELPHFTEYQYTYMMSRLRSSNGLPTRLRATGNPDGPHLEWVRARFAAWIDGQVPHEQSVWFGPDGKRCAPHTKLARSRCYIPGKLSENPYLGEDYLANLLQLDPVTRAKLLDGDWDAAMGEGAMFHRTWWQYLREPPVCERWVRAWDFGAGDDPTEGVLMGDRGAGVVPRFVVLDCISHVGPPHEVHALVQQTANADGPDVTVCVPQDPGQAGKDQAHTFVRELAGYTVVTRRPSQNKTVRAGPYSAQVGARNVALVRAPWNATFVSQHHAFPEHTRDDKIDAGADAMQTLLDVHSSGVTVVQRPLFAA